MQNSDPPVIVCLGELVWDLFPDQRRLGGAPANVCYHVAQLGDRAVLASRVGEDALGREALSMLNARGVDTMATQLDPQRPTGTVEVTFIDGDPSYAVDAAAAWSAMAWSSQWARLLASARVLCFGSLVQADAPGRAVLAEAARAMDPGALRLCDLNLRPGFDTEVAVNAALAAANVVKLSEEEAEELSRRYRQPDPVTWLLRECGMQAVAVTRGNRGSALYTAAGAAEHPGVPTDTSGGDPVGAGDAFTAALAHHLCRGHDPQRALAHANRYAAYVASQRGAMPEIPEELLKDG